MSSQDHPSILRSLLRPTPSLNMSSSDLELSFKTNKGIFLMLTLLVAFEIIRFVSKAFSPIYLPTLAVSIFWMLSFLLCCRTCRGLFAFLATVTACLLPTSIYLLEDFAFLAISIAFTVPIYILLITQSTIGFVLTGFTHFAFINIFNKPFLVQAYHRLTPLEFIDGYLTAANPGIVLMIMIFTSLHLCVQKIGKDLRHSRKQSEESLSQLNTFLMSFSHELRNPINSLLGSLQLAKLEKLSGPVEEMISTAKSSAELLLQLINNMLDSGKFNIGELEIKPKPTNILESASKIWGIASELIRRKKLDCRWKIDKKVPKILMLDSYRFTQIMLNLIGNAVKFTENGHITIDMDWVESQTLNDEMFNLTSEEKSLSKGASVASSSYSLESSEASYYLTQSKKVIKDNSEPLEDEKEGFLRIIVRDSGCGMATEDLEKLFQKFVQVNKDDGKRQIGTGLGLYITKILAQKMRGDIKVCSQVGVGTSFVLCIPTYYSPSFGNGYDKAEALEILKSKKLTAIVADDVQFNTSLLSFYMSKIEGKVYSTKEDGKDAYESFVNAHKMGQRVNLVVADMKMRLMDGKELCKKIRKYEKENCMIPCTIILMSGANYDNEIDMLTDKCGEYQADFFLKKPISFDEFFDVLVKNFNE